MLMFSSKGSANIFKNKQPKKRLLSADKKSFEGIKIFYGKMISLFENFSFSIWKNQVKSETQKKLDACIHRNSLLGWALINPLEN